MIYSIQYSRGPGTEVLMKFRNYFEAMESSRPLADLILLFTAYYSVHSRWLIELKPQINYNQIGNVNRLHNIIEPFAALFQALGIVLAHILQQVTQPASLASLNPGTGTVLYSRGQLGSIRLKTSRLPACSFLAVLILWLKLISYNQLQKPTKLCTLYHALTVWCNDISYIQQDKKSETKICQDMYYVS